MFLQRGARVAIEAVRTARGRELEEEEMKVVSVKPGSVSEAMRTLQMAVKFTRADETARMGSSLG
jgi:hypothetical protein